MRSFAVEFLQELVELGLLLQAVHARRDCSSACPGNALAACRTAPQRFDAFLVGHLLPTASALALASALHEIAPDRPILLATASSSEIAANALITAGISEIVRWPLVASEMAATLTEYFAAPSKRSANYDSNANPRL